GRYATFRIDSEMLPADSEQRTDRGNRRCQGCHFWHVNRKGPDCSLTSLHGQDDETSFRIHREMHDNGAVGPLGYAGEVPAKCHLVTSSLRGPKTLAEEDHLRSDRPTERIDTNTWYQFQWNSVAHLVLDRRTTRPVRQRIGRGQSNPHIARGS